MFAFYRNSGAAIVLFGALAFASAGCNSIDQSRSSGELKSSTYSTPVKPSASAIPSPDISLVCQDVSCNVSTNKTAYDAYEQALLSARSAANVGKSARSAKDWNLAINYWQEAIALLKSVPVSNPHSAIAKNKITEYQRYLVYAQAQSRFNRSPSPTTIAGISGTQKPPALRKIVKPVTPLPTAPTLPNYPTNTIPTTDINQPITLPITNKRVFQVPIKRRRGGVPTIEVLFNGIQKFEMIVDTGASGTLITQKMGESLSLVTVGNAKARTASGTVVEFPIGSVKSIEVGGIVARDMVVAISGSDVETGLLGHDFFGNYDVTIKQDVVEFRER